MAGLAAPVEARVIEAPIARVHAPGDPLIYADGQEYRDAAELKALVDAVNTGTWPLTIFHPDAMLDAGGTAVRGGTLLGARLDGDRAIGRILFDTSEGLAAAKYGIRQLSLGYYSALDHTRHQRRTRIDHLALIPQGKCGVTCAIPKFDASGALVPHVDCAGDTGCSCATKTDETAREDAKLTAGMRKHLPSDDFAAPPDSLPIENADHVRAAMARFNQTHFASAAEKKSAYHRILSHAHKFGVDSSGFEREWSGRLDSTELRVAGTMPMSVGNVLAKELSVDLTQALAALAAANEKVGAIQARADKLEGDLAATTARIDGMTAEHAAQTAALTARADSAVADLAAAKTAEATAAAKRDADAVQAKKDADDAVQAKIDASVSVRVAASTILPTKDAAGKPIDRSKMDDASLMREVVKHVDGIEVAADKHPIYVSAMFEGAVARASKNGAELAAARTALGAHRDAALPQSNTMAVEKAAVEASKTDISSAWLQPAKKGL